MWDLMRNKIHKTIKASCPICGADIPFLYATATRLKWWHPQFTIMLDGDGTDYVAHMWQHTENKTIQKTRQDY